MSDLQKACAKAKLASYPTNTPIPFDEAEEEEAESGDLGELPVDDDSSSASSASSTSSTGTIIPSSNQNLFARPQGLVCLSFKTSGLTSYDQNTEQENSRSDPLDDVL
jgi:protein phosphatase methylesterase 1